MIGKQKGKHLTALVTIPSLPVDGKVLQGPAQKALQTYPAKLEGKTILVKVN